MGQQGQDAKRGGDECIAVGDPAHGPAVGVVHREEQGGDSRSQRLPHEPAVQDGGCRHQSRVPEKAVRVHEHRRVGPKQIVKAMGRNGRGLEELALDERVGPPGKDAKVHPRQVRAGSPRKKLNISPGGPSNSRNGGTSSKTTR